MCVGHMLHAFALFANCQAENALALASSVWLFLFCAILIINYAINLHLYEVIYIAAQYLLLMSNDKDRFMFWLSYFSVS